MVETYETLLAVDGSGHQPYHPVRINTEQRDNAGSASVVTTLKFGIE